MWDSTTIAASDPDPVTRFCLMLVLPLALLPCGAQALDLTMPAPVLGIVAEAEGSASHALPIGVFADGAVPTRAVTGAMDQRAYRLDGGRMTLTDLAAPLLAQLQAQGFSVLLDCETRVCGGFDFRFAIDVMPEPDMHVNLGEFRFISTEKADEAVSLLISRSAGAAFVQVTRIGAEALPAPDLGAMSMPQGAAVSDTSDIAPLAEAPVPEAEATRVEPQGIVETLEARGGVALDDLVFASGAAVLEEGDYASLATLADWLKADEVRRIALVGHTDGSGSLEANIALSKKRAEGVRQVLLMRYKVAPGQVTAEGVGPLAPRASNDTEAGRQKNRRVEAVKTSTQ